MSNASLSGIEDRSVIYVMEFHRVRGKIFRLFITLPKSSNMAVESNSMGSGTTHENCHGQSVCNDRSVGYLSGNTEPFNQLRYGIVVQ